MEHPPQHEPDDPAADTGRFQAFIQDEETESAQAGPRFPAGVLAFLVLVGIVVVTAIVLLRG